MLITTYNALLHVKFIASYNDMNGFREVFSVVMRGTLTSYHFYHNPTSHFCPCVLWYKWTGRTVVHNSICGTLVHPTSVLVSRGTNGQDGQEYTTLSVLH